VEASAEEVAGQDADAGGEQAAGGDGALKRTREEDEAEQQADERDAKRLASGEEQQEANVRGDGGGGCGVFLRAAVGLWWGTEGSHACGVLHLRAAGRRACCGVR
jgi:hypothetical protein